MIPKIIPQIDKFQTELILDYYSNFDTYTGMNKSILLNSVELINYFLYKESITHKPVLNFMIRNGMWLSSKLNNCDLLKLFVDIYQKNKGIITYNDCNLIQYYSLCTNNFQFVDYKIEEYVSSIWPK